MRVPTPVTVVRDSSLEVCAGRVRRLWVSIGVDCCFGGTLLKDVEYLSFTINSKQLLLWQRLVSTGPSTDEMHLVYLCLTRECEYITKNASFGAWVIPHRGPIKWCFSKVDERKGK